MVVRRHSQLNIFIRINRTQTMCRIRPNDILDHKSIDWTCCSAIALNGQSMMDDKRISIIWNGNLWYETTFRQCVNHVKSNRFVFLGKAEHFEWKLNVLLSKREEKRTNWCLFGMSVVLEQKHWVNEFNLTPLSQQQQSSIFKALRYVGQTPTWTHWFDCVKMSKMKYYRSNRINDTEVIEVDYRRPLAYGRCAKWTS